MKNNEGGFTYPLTLSILILFLFFFSTKVEQLLIDRKMAHETKIILLQEYYMLTSAKKIENMLQSVDSIQANGTFAYRYGNMDYKSDIPADTTQKISFTLRLYSGETFLGFGYYDTFTKKMIKWIEKN